MKQNKIAIIVLVIVVLLFIVSLNAGLFREKEEGDDTLSISKVEKMKSGWLIRMDAFMEPFKPAFDLRRIATVPKFNKAEGTIALTDENKCDIEIRDSVNGKKVEDVQNMTIAVQGADVPLKVAYFLKEDQSESSRGVLTSGTGSRPVAHMTSVLGDRHRPVIRPGAPHIPVELIVTYFPDGKIIETNKDYEAEDKVRLSVMPKGGILRLECKGCNRQQNRSLTVKLK